MTKSAVQKREWPIILIAFLFMFFFGRILGPFSVVTQVGSNALGVFIGVILLTVFTSQSTLAAILGIIAMVYSGFLTSSAAVSSWMGGSTVPQLIFVSALCVALKEAGVIDVLVRKLLSIKALRGRPVALLLDREEIDNRFIWHDAIKVIPVYIIVVYVIALGCSYILP